MEQSHFMKYMHVERVGNSNVKGITDGHVYFFPKLDGANASIWVEWGSDKGEYMICAGSRNHELNDDFDNIKFYRVIKDIESYKSYLVTHPTHIIFGEWLIPHTIKGYMDDAWNKFYVFDVYDTKTNKYIPYKEYSEILPRFGFNVIPPLCEMYSNGVNLENKIYSELENNKYLMKDDGGIGEGIVIKNYDFVNKYGRTVWAKAIRSDFKRSMVVENNSSESTEVKIVNSLLTGDDINHEALKYIEEYGEYTNKDYPKFLGIMWNGWFEDKVMDIVKKAGRNDINFFKLRRVFEEVVKQYYPPR